MISIRPYSAGDQSAIEELMKELQKHLSDIDPLKRVRNIEDFDASNYIDRLLEKVESTDGKIFIAEEDGRPLGFVAGIISGGDSDDSLDHYPATEGNVVELVVSQKHRGQGTGRMLMEKMEEFLKENGCEYVRVGCFAGNTGTHAFYEKCGYGDRYIELLKRLS